MRLSMERRLILARGDQYRFTADLVNPTDAEGV
jgi:hypothetical protein